MKKSFYLFTFLLLAMSVYATGVYAQARPFFTVEGEVLKPLKLTLEDLYKFKQTIVDTKDREGKEHSFKGVPLVEILDSAGVTLGKDLRGENLTKYLLIKAADGYEVIFSLPEIDPEFTGDTIILAYQVDGSLLPKGDGPFRIVAPNDKRQARWIRELTSIKIAFSKE